MFAALGSAEIEAVLASGEVREVAAGAHIFREGDTGDGVYLVINGTVEISAMVNEGERKLLAVISAGDFFGEMAVVDKLPRSATAGAGEAARLLFIPSRAMEEALERSPVLAVNLVREFSHRMRRFDRRYVQQLLEAERLTLVGRFARSIVHDFKNPLSIINMAAELGASPDAPPALQETTKNQIRKQIVRLSNMINEVLDFTAGASSTSMLVKTSYAEFLLPLIEDLRTEAQLKQVRLEVQNPPPDVPLMLDTGRLTNVFYNLVHNAVDAVLPDGGKVHFRFATAPESVTTEIEDTGKGIAPEIAARLFEPFVTHGKARGTGLGLSICRRIIQDHRGSIRAIQEPGRGARFQFLLPRPGGAQA